MTDLEDGEACWHAELWRLGFREEKETFVQMKRNQNKKVRAEKEEDDPRVKQTCTANFYGRKDKNKCVNSHESAYPPEAPIATKSVAADSLDSQTRRGKNDRIGTACVRACV